MVCHCVEAGARATAVTLLWRDVLGPGAALAWMALGRHVTDFALEGDEVDETKGMIPEDHIDKEGTLEELRVHPATDAAESSEDECHGLGQGEERQQGGARVQLRLSIHLRNYISVNGTAVEHFRRKMTAEDE